MGTPLSHRVFKLNNMKTHHRHLQRITIITETYRPEVNGVANTLSHIVDGLCARGIQVQVIRPQQHAADEGEFDQGIESVLMAGLPIPGYKALRFGLPNSGKIRKALSAFSPDSLYVATEGPLGLAAVKAAKALSIPVISGFHTNFHQYFSHYHLGILTPLVYRYLRYFHNQTQGTLAPTKRLQHELQTCGFEQVNVLSRGVNAERFHPSKRCNMLRAEWGLTDQDLAVIYVGRLAAEKNIELAVQAYQQMQSEDARLRFILVGDGPQAAKLKELHPEFVFAGTQTGESLARHYASADIFLFPSKTDTFGNVVLEAMASALAVVAFDDAAAHQHIQHEQTGLLAPFHPQSIDLDKGFVELAQSLVNRPNLLRYIRQNARQHAESIRWERIVDTFCEYLSMETPEHGTSKTTAVI